MIFARFQKNLKDPSKIILWNNSGINIDCQYVNVDCRGVIMFSKVNYVFCYLEQFSRIINLSSLYS